jgi:hypothetical protein
VSDARAQQVANDPVTNLFRERSKATAPGLAKEVWVGVDREIVKTCGSGVSGGLLITS